VRVRALAEGAGVRRFERDGAVEIGEGERHPVDEVVDGAAADQHVRQFFRLVLECLDQRGAGGDALLG
jgi:hypothetical protein